MRSGALVAIVLALAACSPPPPAPLVAENGDAVAEEFRALCETVRAGDNPYYGRAALERYEAWAAQPVEDPLARATALARWGVELLRVGRSTDAARVLDDAFETAHAANLEPDLQLDLRRRAALAHLRRGEQENCIRHHAPESCILPLVRSAMHRDRSGSEEALERYLAYMQRDPGNPTVIWLANLAAMTIDRWPQAIPDGWRVDPATIEPHSGFPQFAETGIERGLTERRPSGGMVADDFDGDGDLDLVTSSIDPCASLLLLRNDGTGRFEDATAESGLDAQRGGLNLVQADFDGDGDPDLLVLRGGWFGDDGRMRNSLLLNDGTARFSDVTRDAGLAEPAFPTQTAAWGDYDNDGDLDLYVGNESAEDLYRGGRGDGSAFPSQLFRNDGGGRFVDVAAAAGVTNDRFAKGVAWGDYDDDGDLDLYVSNIGPNRLYRNEGPRGFVDVAAAAGVEEPSGRSFATWFFDYDNDGRLDLFVASYEASGEQVAAHLLGLDVSPEGRPRLYRNLGGGRFEERGGKAGFTRPLLPMGANFGDLDNDGWLDVYLGTGTPSFESLQPNRMYRNVAGERFEDVTWSGRFGHIQKGHGIAFADLDADGDADVVEQMGGAYPGDAYSDALYENPGFGNAWIELALEGTRSNRHGLGSRVALSVRMVGGARREIHRVAGSTGSFGGNPTALLVGLGSGVVAVDAEVRWLGSGRRQRFEGLRPGTRYTLVEGRSDARIRGNPAPVEAALPGRYNEPPVRLARLIEEF